MQGSSSINIDEYMDRELNDDGADEGDLDALFGDTDEPDFLDSQGESGSPLNRRQRWTITCPYAGEDYRPTSQQTSGRRGTHRVTSSVDTELRDDGLVVVVHARCVCGWSDDVVLGGSP